jgi:hypothetical protein
VRTTLATVASRVSRSRSSTSRKTANAWAFTTPEKAPKTIATSTASLNPGTRLIATRPIATHTPTATISGIRLGSRSDSLPTAIPTRGAATKVSMNSPTAGSSTPRV